MAEIRRARDLAFLCGFIPVVPPFGRPHWQDEEWDPLWAAFADTGMVIGFHIGTEPMRPAQMTGVYSRGRGGAIMNYVETTYGGQRAATQLIACGAFDRYPGLRVLVSEAGATWGPFLADRMDEAHRQHSAAVRPTPARQPSEYLYENVYASFQHDRSAVHRRRCTSCSTESIRRVSERIRIGAFRELFPSVPEPPKDLDAAAA